MKEKAGQTKWTRRHCWDNINWPVESAIFNPPGYISESDVECTINLAIHRFQNFKNTKISSRFQSHLIFSKFLFPLLFILVWPAQSACVAAEIGCLPDATSDADGTLFYFFGMNGNEENSRNFKKGILYFKEKETFVVISVLK